MATLRSETVLLVSYESREALGAAYLESLRHHAVRYSAPLILEVMRRIALQFVLPDGTSLTTFAQVMRRYKGPCYALRLLPGAGTETLLGLAREAAWELAENDEMEETSDFFERRVDLPNPEDEDTILELELTEQELTPMAEVLREGSGRFIEWLEREDQRLGEFASRLAPEPGGMETTMVIPARDSSRHAEADPRYLFSQMPLREKMQLAVSGQRPLREALMSEGDPALQMWVMRNPSLEEDEVAAYVSDYRLSVETIDFLMNSPKWSFATDVVRNLVLNPVLPPEKLPLLLQVLPTPVLEELSRSVTVPPLVRGRAGEALAERST
jgi:hypothetical protein